MLSLFFRINITYDTFAKSLITHEWLILDKT